MRSMATSALATTLALFMAPDFAHGQVPDAPLRITAFAVNMSNMGNGRTNVVDIEINRWSTDAERQQLIAAFLEKGPNALLSALERTRRVGYMRLPTTLGYDLHYAHKHPLEEGGEQIIALTNRRVGFWEARDQPRSIDYPFTLIDIRITKNEAAGKLSVATKISYNTRKNTVELEHYASEPVRLQNIKAEAKR